MLFNMLKQFIFVHNQTFLDINWATDWGIQINPFDTSNTNQPLIQWWPRNLNRESLSNPSRPSPIYTSSFLPPSFISNFQAPRPNQGANDLAWYAGRHRRRYEELYFRRAAAVRWTNQPTNATVAAPPSPSWNGEWLSSRSVVQSDIQIKNP